jgi:fructan beta-fructosidase
MMIYSGSAVVDWNNSSGLGDPEHPPLVAIYTAHYRDHTRENQEIAFSTDRGRTWTKYAGNPVLDVEETDFRDPKVFWHAPSDRWIMVVALPVSRKVSFYASSNLKQWRHLSDFGPAGATIGVWECPDLFELPVDGDASDTRWILIVNLNPGGPAGGSGCQYFVGQFDGERFVLDPGAHPEDKNDAVWLDFGPDYYAAVSWSGIPDDDGRRVMIGWLSNWMYASMVPTAPWRGAMTVPRVVSLRKVDNTCRLLQEPIEELASLRSDLSRHFQGSMETVAGRLRELGELPCCLDMDITVAKVPADGAFSLSLAFGQNERISVLCDRARGRLSVDRSRSGDVDFSPGFASRHGAPLSVLDDEVHLRLLVDACSLEVFAQDGATLVTMLMFPSTSTCRLSIEDGAASPQISMEVSLHVLESACSPEAQV